MSKNNFPIAWRPTRTQVLAGGIVVAGNALSSFSWWFFTLVGIGMFGPGLLREFGLLHDQDEFQRRAAHRAGYHAFLTVGLTAIILVAYFRSGDREVRDSRELASFFLGLLWFAWFSSSLVGYWGKSKAAARILTVFGILWFTFAIISNLGSEWNGWASLLLHPLLAVPFFGLAWLAGRRPRITGLLLLAAAAGFMHLFGWFQDFSVGKLVDGPVIILFVGPLLASGMALLTEVAPDENLA